MYPPEGEIDDLAELVTWSNVKKTYDVRQQCHRNITVKEIGKIRKTDSLMGYEDVCFVCGEANTQDNQVNLCSSPGCCKSYHKGCLIGDDRIMIDEDTWTCPPCQDNFDLPNTNVTLLKTYQNVSRLLIDIKTENDRNNVVEWDSLGSIYYWKNKDEEMLNRVNLKQ